MSKIVLTAIEKTFLLAGVKALFKANEKDPVLNVFYADIFARLSEQESLDPISLDFVTKFVDKVIEALTKVTESKKENTEAVLRASVIKETYVGLQRRINAK